METISNVRPQLDDTANLSNQVFGILDSKIQYIKFSIQQVMRDYIDIDKIKQLPPEIGISFIQDKEAIFNRNAKIFEKIERFNRHLSQLLFLRKQLNKRNSKKILMLISEDRYNFYSEDKLLSMLEKDCSFDSLLARHSSDN